ncbi:Zinc-finger domain [Fragilaria crotonensis]|nr:Zinc-finger domain [Fragilaria crotonensis]
MKSAVVASTRIAARTVARQSRCMSVDVKDKSKYYFSAGDPPYVHGKHRSNALELVSKQPVIEVDGEMAICDGGGGSLGHPVEYISLQRPGVIETCKYCALKYKSKDDHH